jgi:hypothetical protein
MRFIDLSMRVHGAVLRKKLVAAADLEAAKVRACLAILSPSPTKTAFTVAGWEDLVLHQTLSQGLGLVTIWKGPLVASSAIVLAGTDLPAEAELLDSLLQSIWRSRAAAAAGLSEESFVEFYIEERRPAVFHVIWPTADEAEADRLAEIVRYVAAAFFQALGLQRDAAYG